jgi:methylene-fatty-acyl-phospholipid synthase
MIIVWLLASAAVLSLERVCYVWVWRKPDRFVALRSRVAFLAGGDAPGALARLFVVFKILQAGVFAAWWIRFDRIWPVAPEPLTVGIGLALAACGQVLNGAVFYQLGRIGVFYGSRLGYELPRCQGFPFSLLKHPQYVGTVLSIWGLFIAARFPAADWYWLPAIESVYYAMGSRLEQHSTPAPEPASARARRREIPAASAPHS